MLYITVLAIIFTFFSISIFWFSIPKFLEQPKYKVIIDKDPFQIRAYEEFLICEIQVNGTQKDALRKGFIPLARFIGGKDREGEKISMTVPVMQKLKASPYDWSVSFFMPSKFNGRSLPKTNNSQIESRTIKATTFATLRFRGNPSYSKLLEKEVELSTILENYGYDAVDESMFAFYNDPLTPGFLRRNEIFIEVIEEE